MAVTTYVQLKAHNRDLLHGVQESYVITDTAASSTINVESIVGFADGDYLLIGEFGQETAEIVRVNGTPSGNTITLAANTVEAHNAGEKVYNIDRNQVVFLRATTLLGSKSELVSVDIDAGSLHTIYEDTVNVSGFGFYRWKNSSDSTFSNFSAAIPYTGYTEQQVLNIIEPVMRQMGYVDSNGTVEYPAKIRREALIEFINDCEEDVASRKNRWSFYEDFDASISEITTGEDAYPLPDDVAFEHGNRSFQNVRIEGRDELKWMDKSEFNIKRKEVVKNTLNGAISATTDTTITLTDSSAFPDAGTISIVNDDEEGTDEITYTANDRTTNVLSGVTNISETHADGATVWYGARLSEPTHYTVFEDTMYLDPPPAAEWENYPLLADLYTRPTRVNDLYDTVRVPAFVVKRYVKWAATLLKYDGDQARAAGDFALYERAVNQLILKESTGQRFRFTPVRSAAEYGRQPKEQTKSDATQGATS